MPLDPDACYRAVNTRDSRFDGQFVTAVKTTGIYCRPACPSRTPNRGNVTFLPTVAAAQAAGFRACRRCLPDAAPGSPAWNLRTDVVGAAMRLIGDGIVDREGVAGLAHRVGYSERHLARILIAEIGASPVALARARRADAARTLLTSTSLPISDVAFAAGFSSIRQFNDTIREVYATDPTTLRSARRVGRAAPGTLTVHLPVRAPFDGPGLLRFLAHRTVDGVEAIRGHRYARTLRLPRATGTVVLTLPAATDGDAQRSVTVTAQLRLERLDDLTAAVQRCRRLLDADADPVGIDTALAADPALAPLVARTPGIRVPGTVDGPEILVRALVGQQVSVAAARTALGKLARAAGELIRPAGSVGTAHPVIPEAAPSSDGETADPAAQLTHLFPSPAALAALRPAAIGGPRRRAEAIAAAAADMASGALEIHAGRRAEELTAELVARRGIGPWTAGYVTMRVLGAPDVLLTGDLALRHGAAALGLPDDAAGVTRHAEGWRPWRSYAGMHLWRVAAQPGTVPPSSRPQNAPRIRPQNAPRSRPRTAEPVNPHAPEAATP